MVAEPLENPAAERLSSLVASGELFKAPRGHDLHALLARIGKAVQKPGDAPVVENRADGLHRGGAARLLRAHVELLEAQGERTLSGALLLLLFLLLLSLCLILVFLRLLSFFSPIRPISLISSVVVFSPLDALGLGACLEFVHGSDEIGLQSKRLGKHALRLARAA